MRTPPSLAMGAEAAMTLRVYCPDERGLTLQAADLEGADKSGGDSVPKTA